MSPTGKLEKFLLALVTDQDLYEAWIADPYEAGLNFAPSLTTAEVDLLLQGGKAAIDYALEKEGSTGKYHPRGQVVR